MKVFRILIMVTLVLVVLMAGAPAMAAQEEKSVNDVSLEHKRSVFIQYPEDLNQALTKSVNAAPTALAENNKWAVVFGDNGYGNENIAGDNNARLMASTLKSVYGFNSSNIRLLVNNKFTAQSVSQSLEWLRQNTDSNSSVFLFYSGHGSPMAVLHMNTWYLNNEFSTIKYGKLCMVFEACFSGSMCDPLAGTNRVIIGSTLPDVYGTTNSSWSGFSKCFIEEGMKDALADINNDGFVSTEEAFNYMCTRTAHGTISDNYPGELVP